MSPPSSLSKIKPSRKSSVQRVASKALCVKTYRSTQSMSMKMKNICQRNSKSYLIRSCSFPCTIDVTNNTSTDLTNFMPNILEIMDSPIKIDH
jgi:hypothetical protein